MKRIRVNLDKISDFDLQLAKNPRVTAALDDIIPLSLEQRAHELKTLQQKTDRGETDLFEEHVRSYLLEHRNAEWIRVIHKNFATIEQELQKRQPPQPAPPPETLPSSQAIRAPKPPRRTVHQTHSELLDFLATQKPPKLPASSSDRSTKVPVEKKVPLFSMKESALAVLLLIVLASSIGFVAFSKDEPSEELLTFREQEQIDSPEAREDRRRDEEMQTKFDAAAQELRFGNFESGKIRLFELAESSLQSVHAENAYVLIADTARLRKSDQALALQTYQTFLEKWPESPKAGLVQLKMGFSYEDLEDFSSAETAYRLLIANVGEKSRLGQLARERLLRLKKSEL
ncbi:MAG: hypothetical protein GY801_11075 [bacterium]|nr:hypothetical protein [bacterium]